MGFVTNLPTDYFAAGFQSAKDAEASTFYFFKHQDGTGLDIDEDVVSEREGGDGQEVGLRYKRLIKMDGGANARARAQAAAVGAAANLGKTATIIGGPSHVSPLATGLQVHRYVGNATLPYLTVEQRYADIIERVSNVKVPGFDIEGEAGSPISLTYSFVSGGTPYRRAIASTLTPARESGPPIQFPRGSYTVDGAGTTKITKFKVSPKVNVDDGIQTVELFREDVLELTRDYDLDFTLKYEDSTLYDKIKFAGGTQIPIALATGAFMAAMDNGLARTATAYRQAVVNMPMIQYVGAKLNRLDPDGKTVYLDVSAMSIPGATNSFIMDVVVASQAALV